VCVSVSGQIRYSIPEEMQKGSSVGNIAKDLGLDVEQLSDRAVRILSRGRTQYFALNFKSGHLYVTERIDREEICGGMEMCLLNCEVIVEDKMKLFPVEVEITDINDNAPSFRSEEFDLKISETTAPGSRFSVRQAEDPDMGLNSIQSYQLNSNTHFLLDVETRSGGVKYAELVLEKSLDREEQAVHNLILTATDGGDPVRSGTTQIRVIVLDSNDNAPVFSQPVYKVSVWENVPEGSMVVTVKATDLDEGVNKEVKYSFQKITDKAPQMFHLDPKTGEITVVGKLDFEEAALYEAEKFSLDSENGKITVKEPLDFEETRDYTMAVEAKDGGGLVTHCKVEIEVIDENDNAPEVTFTSVSSPVPEDSVPGTVIALISVNDLDFGDNGKVACHLMDDFPFTIRSSSNNYYKLLTDSPLDREKTPEYNITITATDKGTPPLSTQKTILLQISDINDNAPVFKKPSYTAYVPENNPSGASIFSVKASDRDLDRNARVTYSILSSNLQEVPLSSYISINSQTGAIYAQRSFDYEQFREFEMQVQAQDGGSPPLSSNVTVRVFILDQNDNAPRILYPSVGADGSALFEMVPRSAEAGYLVTKVVAVDADSGHNAWLSYHLLQATEPTLFSMGLHTGEIRTARAFADRDAVKHRLVTLVKDNGQPPLSVTVTLNLVFAENFQEALPEMSDQSGDSTPQSDLQFYLVLALALISFLFLLTVTLAIVMKLRRSRKPKLLQCFGPDPYSKTGSMFPPNYEDGTLPYSYQLCLSSDTRKNDFSFLIPSVQKELSGLSILSRKPKVVSSALERTT
uniref:Cadherin domain-containing protein n=1 Tax=Chelonoidis abingdonii TaxID=106734 RepID=A0A8C0JCE1_CHEAB